MADILWKIAHQQIPSGFKTSYLATDGADCPWCPSTVNSIAHLFHDCPTAALIWAQTIQVAMLITHSLTPLDDLIHHSSLSHQRIGRILQSVAIYTKWIAYTKCAFSSPTPSPLSRQEISNLLLTQILSQHTLDMHCINSPGLPPLLLFIFLTNSIHIYIYPIAP